MRLFSKYALEQKPEVDIETLSSRQQEVVAILTEADQLPLRGIIAKMDNPPTGKTVAEVLQNLKQLGLVDSRGRGFGAVWFLVNKQ